MYVLKNMYTHLSIHIYMYIYMYVQRIHDPCPFGLPEYVDRGSRRQQPARLTALADSSWSASERIQSVPGCTDPWTEPTTTSSHTPPPPTNPKEGLNKLRTSLSIWCMAGGSIGLYEEWHQAEWLLRGARWIRISCYVCGFGNGSLNRNPHQGGSLQCKCICKLIRISSVLPGLACGQEGEMCDQRINECPSGLANQRGIFIVVMAVSGGWVP